MLKPKFNNSHFYTETNTPTIWILFLNSSFASIKSEEEVEIIIDVEFQFVFSLVKLKFKTDELFGIRLKHVIR